MKRFSIYILLCLLTSCDFFVSKAEKTAELVDKELQEIDWSEVDSYPLFENCDETVSRAVQRKCFEEKLLSHCKITLAEFEFKFDTLVNPKVIVDFVVDQDGRISIMKFEKDDTIDSQMPEFEQIITQGLKNIPPLAPALKRGVPVKSKFRIPIVLKGSTVK